MLVVVCPCGAKLKAPDAAAGKRVKCPKCGSPLAVPAPAADFEEVDDTPPPVAKAVPKKPTRVDDDDELPPTKKMPMAGKRKPEPVEVNEAIDDDEDDDTSKKKKKGKGKKGKKGEPKSKLPLILGIGGGVFVLLAVVGIIVGVMMSGSGGGQTKGTNTQPTKSALPPGWSEFKGEGFRVAVPDAVQFKKLDQKEREVIGVGGPQGTEGAAYANANLDPQAMPPWVYVAAVGQVPEPQLNAMRQDPEGSWDQLKRFFALAGTVEMTAVTVAGAEGKQFVITNDAQKKYVVSRVVIKGDRSYVWTVTSQTKPAADDPNVKPFFDTFVIE